MKEARDQTEVPEWGMTAGVVFVALMALVLLWFAFFGGEGEAQRPVSVGAGVPSDAAPSLTGGTGPSLQAAANTAAELDVANRGAVAFLTGDWSRVPVAPTFTPPPPARKLAAPVVVSTQPLGYGKWEVSYRPSAESTAAPSTVQVIVVPTGSTYAVSGGGPL